MQPLEIHKESAVENDILPDKIPAKQSLRPRGPLVPPRLVPPQSPKPPLPDRKNPPNPVPFHLTHQLPRHKEPKHPRFANI